MKKIISGIVASAFCAACIPWGNVSVSASESDFISAFFPNGSINAPSHAPYVIYSDRDYDGNNMTAETEMFYELSDDLFRFNDEVATLGESGFLDEYGVTPETEGIQIDVKFDDGAWLSQTYDCDHFDYGYNLDPDGNIFLLRDYFPCSNLDRVHYLNQGWLEYYYEDDETIDFMKPYVKVTEDEDGFSYVQFDTENHRVSFRYRYYVTYYPDGYSNYTTPEGNVIFSGWSPESSFGAGGCQYGIGAPDGISAPSISNFTFVQNEYEFYDAKYYIQIPDSVNEGIRYYFINEDMTSDVYEIETQIRINGGEWVDTMTADSMIINSCYKTASYYEGAIPDNSTAEIRARITDIYGNESGWSNVLSVAPDYIPEYQDSFIAQALVTEKKEKKGDEKEDVKDGKSEVTEEPAVTAVTVLGTDKHGFDIVSVVEDPSGIDGGDNESNALDSIPGRNEVSQRTKLIVYILIGLVVIAGAAGVALVVRKGKKGKPVDVIIEGDNEDEISEEAVFYESSEPEDDGRVIEIDEELGNTESYNAENAVNAEEPEDGSSDSKES